MESATASGAADLPHTPPHAVHISHAHLSSAPTAMVPPAAPVQTDTVQSSIASLSLMEPHSGKRTHSPENGQSGVKRVKLDDELCSCGVSHGKGLSIESTESKSHNWADVIRHVMKTDNSDVTHKV